MQVQTLTCANSPISSWYNVFTWSTTRHAIPNCLNLKQAVLNSHVVLYTADQAICACAVKAGTRKPVGSMFPHNIVFIGASRSREIGAGYFTLQAAALSFAVAKPLLSVSKSVTMEIPTSSLCFRA